MTTRMIYLIATLLLVVGLLLMATTAEAGTAFFKREIQTGGMTKQCVYDHLGSVYVMTIPVTRICPITINLP